MQALLVPLLKQLTPDRFRSAHELASRLDVTPDAVTQALQQAIARATPVEYRPERGFRLLAALDWLDPAYCAQRLSGAGLQLQVLDCCGSTNAELMQAARQGASDGLVLTAELQTEGRGRQGRRWHSGLCSALTFSLLWRAHVPVAALSGLSLATGVALVRALRGRGVAAELKWPNDLLWQGRKLGGVLIEVKGDAAGPCAAVIGVGINVRLSGSQRAQIDQPVADLHEAGGGSISRSDWLCDVLLEMRSMLNVFALSGFGAMRSEWDRYHAHAGRQVQIALPTGRRMHGLAAGVDEQGSLLLATAHGTQAVTAGDVTLRAGA